MRHIALLGIQLHGNDAGMLRGVFRYARQRSDWVIHDSTWSSIWSSGPDDRPAGVIANVVSAGVADRCAALGVPVVNVSGRIPGLHAFPSVTVDGEAVGALAAQHLLDCGLRHFAWFNLMLDYPFIGQRGLAFERALRAKGYRCDVFNRALPLTVHVPGGGASDAHPALASWLHAVPKPCGIFATTDQSGREVCWLCRQCGYHVPEEVAVVGVDDFDLICETSHPPLSSVRLPNEEIGFRAAELIDAILSGGTAPADTLFPPLNVTTRMSSDVVAVSDRAVAAALAHIRRHASDRLDVETVARAAGLNRRSLERRFRQALGRTVLNEIHAALVAAAQRLLVDTDLPVSEIAVRAGFRDAQHLNLVFRKAASLSPTAFRRRARTAL